MSLLDATSASLPRAVFATVCLAAVWAPPTHALEITRHDIGISSIDLRGVRIDQNVCLERGSPPYPGGDPECVSQQFDLVSERAAASELRYETTQSPDFAGSPTASHESEITATAIRGSGSVALGTRPVELDGWVEVRSRFEYGFAIDEAADFHLIGLLRRPQIFDVPVGSGFAWLQLCEFNRFGCGTSNRIFGALLNDQPPFEIEIDERGRLEAGAYLLVVRAGDQSAGLSDSAASWEFELTLTPVPEPALGGLLLAALALAAIARSRG